MTTSCKPNWKSRPKRLEDDSRYVYFIGSPHVIAYNPDKLQESDLPKTYDELLDPKWDHKVVMRNPLGGNSPAFALRSRYRETFARRMSSYLSSTMYDGKSFIEGAPSSVASGASFCWINPLSVDGASGASAVPSSEGGSASPVP